VLGFVPGATQAPPADAPEIGVANGYSYLLGLFPVNAVHNVIHLVIGVVGLTAYGGFIGAQTFARGLAVVYGLLAIMGVIPALQTVFGYAPIFGHDVWLHAVTALAAAYVGWAAKADVNRDVPAGMRA
jgi:hypothetical protein